MFDLPCPTEATADSIVQPPLIIGSFVLNEPVMVITDLMVSAVCFYAWYKLRQIPTKSTARNFLLIYFFSMGLATTIGGIVGHGLMHYLSFSYKLPGWFTSMISIAVLERACIEIAKPHIRSKIGTFFTYLNIVELLTFMTISFGTLCFFYVEVHSSYGLLVVTLGFSYFVFRRTGNEGSKNFLYGVATAAVAAIVYTMEWSISIWFTYTDLGHVIMCLATWYFYKGSRIIFLQDARETPQAT